MQLRLNTGRTYVKLVANLFFRICFSRYGSKQYLMQEFWVVCDLIVSKLPQIKCFLFLYYGCCYLFRREYSSRLKHLLRTEKLPAQQPGSETQPRYKAAKHPRVEKQVIKSSSWNQVNELVVQGFPSSDNDNVDDEDESNNVDNNNAK